MPLPLANVGDFVGVVGCCFFLGGPLPIPANTLAQSATSGVQKDYHGDHKTDLRSLMDRGDVSVALSLLLHWRLAIGTGIGIEQRSRSHASISLRNEGADGRLVLLSGSGR
jgi:hypothetical protein